MPTEIVASVVVSISINVFTWFFTWLRKDAVIQKVNEYQSEKLAEVYKQHLDLASRMDKHEEKFNSHNSNSQTFDKEMTIKYDYLEMEVKEFKDTVKELTRGLQELLVEVKTRK